MKFNNINLQGIGEIQNAKFQQLSSAPTPQEALFYYDTTLHKFGYYNGTEWVYDTELTYANVIAALGFTPYNATNPNGYISGITGADVTAALGFTPYNSSNPDGYITGITSSDVTGALGYTPYNSTNPNGYQANVLESVAVNGTAQTITDKSVNIVVPTKTSDITNDSGFITSASLPTVNNATLTIQKNGSNVATFTANSSTNQTANITVPTTAADVGALPDTTTISDLVTSAQLNAINSGATTTNIGQIATNTSAISTINGKIPSQASTTNQLADKDFVNSSISTNTAYFDGSWATYAAIPTSASGFTSAGYPEPTNNNYLVVVEDETQDGGTWRYKYVDDGGAYAKANWKVEYEVNETPLTAAQIAALNSGATTTNIGQISTNTSDIADLRTNKQNTITDLATIRSNASNGQSAYTTIQGYGDIVTHNVSEFATAAQGALADTALQSIPIASANTLGGIKVGNNLSIDANGVLSADAQGITIDSALSTTSVNPVQNKVVTTAINGKSSVTFVDWTV